MAFFVNLPTFLRSQRSIVILRYFRLFLISNTLVFTLLLSDIILRILPCFVLINFNILFGGALVFDVFEEHRILDHLLIGERDLQPAYTLLVVEIVAYFENLTILFILNRNILDMVDHF